MPSAVHFDADAYQSSLTLPTLHLNGRLYTGRLLSLDEYLQFAGRLSADGAGIAGDTVRHGATFKALVRDLTTLIYGRGRPWWAFWRPTVAAQLLAMPLSVQLEALKSFSRSQATKFAHDAERVTNTPRTTPTPPSA